MNKRSEPGSGRLSLFAHVLGDEFESLPPALRELHASTGLSVFEGQARNLGPSGLRGLVAAWIGGFPKSPAATPVRVTIRADTEREVWLREFGKTRFSSVLSQHRRGGLVERFGLLSFHIALHATDGKLYFPVSSGRLFGIIPVPKPLVPQSIASEFEDGQGRFNFDVLLQFGRHVRVAHYRGWLARVEP